MNWVDLGILFILVFFTFEGFGRNFFAETLDLLAFGVAFLGSLRFYNYSAKLVATMFQVPHALANVLGFVAIWFIIEAVLFVLIRAGFWRLKWVNHLTPRLAPFSMIPAFFRGLIFVALILLIIGTFPLNPGLKVAVKNSLIGSRILAQVEGFEGPFKSVFGGISNNSLSFLTIKPKSDETINLGFTLNDFLPDEKQEAEMIVLVNKERVSRGVAALKFDLGLREVARSHSMDMFQRGYFAHHSPDGKSVADRADERQIEYLVIGENLAFAPSLSLAHNGLMNSEGHRANILSTDYTKIGIGIMDGKEYGLMFTQVFSN